MTREESREWVRQNLPRVRGKAAQKFAQSVYKNPDLCKVYKDAYDSIPDIFPAESASNTNPVIAGPWPSLPPPSVPLSNN
jgi:hypothetical protein